MWGKWYWDVWLIVASVTLGGPEVYALATDANNTLSAYVWAALKVSKDQQQPWTAAHFLVFGAWSVAVSWLTWHLFFRRFT